MSCQRGPTSLKMVKVAKRRAQVVCDRGRRYRVKGHKCNRVHLARAIDTMPCYVELNLTEGDSMYPEILSATFLAG
jgi:hypothetical protein